MECECGGVLIEGRSSYSASNDNFSLILDNIPAFKCTRCDKVLFEDDVVEKIHKLVNKIGRESAVIVTGNPSVNLYDYQK